ncbi:MAG: hypothetical protein J6A38_06445 [Clostridia bacterium]|nr:hypothetical protein [Clostridia bacterium]
MTLNAILLSKNAVGMIPTIAVIVCSALIGIAFLVGFYKGLRKVSWGGFVWLFSGAGFFIASKYLKKFLLKAPIVRGLKENVKGVVATFLIALACVLAVLIVYGFFSLVLRPRSKWKKDKELEYDVYGFAYEPDYEDYDDYNDEAHYNKVLVRKGYAKPSWFGRLTGGVASAVNVAMILAVVLSIALYVVGTTKLRNGSLGALYDAKIVRYAWKYAQIYTLDFLTIGIIICTALKGYQKGLIGSLRALIVVLGAIAIVVVCFALPFRMKSGFIVNLSNRCAEIFNGFKSLDPSVRRLIGKLLAGLLLCIGGLLALALVNFILGKVANAINGTAPTRMLDGMLACLLYLVIGAVICLAIWSALYVLDYCEILQIQKYFNEHTTLAEGTFEIAEEYIKPWIDKALKK